MLYMIPRHATGLLLILTLGMAGCGKPVGSVSGTVTFNGKALSSGTVLFNCADGHFEHTQIAADGWYEIASAPLGLVRISVVPHARAPLGMPYAGKPPTEATVGITKIDEPPRDGKFTVIPPRYQDKVNSPLMFTVQSGHQTFDIEMVP